MAEEVPGQFRQLAAFVAVADTLNFGRAAERLGTSQPPVSRLVLRLERRIGAPLFTRHRRGVTLTGVGAALVGPAREVLQAEQDFERAAAGALTGDLGVLRVGTTEGAIDLISETLRAFAARRPGIEVRLEQAHTPAKLDRLRRGLLDAVFVRNPPPTPGVVTVEVLREPLLAVMATDHPLAGPITSLRHLAAYPLLVTPGSINTGVRDAVLRLLSDTGVSPRLGPPLLAQADAIAQIASSDAWTLLSLGTARTVGLTVTAVPLVEDATATISLAWRSHDHSALLRDFTDAALLSRR